MCRTLWELRRATPNPELEVRNEILEEDDIETIGISNSKEGGRCPGRRNSRSGGETLRGVLTPLQSGSSWIDLENVHS